MKKDTNCNQCEDCQCNRITLVNIEKTRKAEKNRLKNRAVNLFTIISVIFFLLVFLPLRFMSADIKYYLFFGAVAFFFYMIAIFK